MDGMSFKSSRKNQIDTSAARAALKNAKALVKDDELTVEIWKAQFRQNGAIPNDYLSDKNYSDLFPLSVQSGKLHNTKRKPSLDKSKPSVSSDYDPKSHLSEQVQNLRDVREKAEERLKKSQLQIQVAQDMNNEHHSLVFNDTVQRVMDKRLEELEKSFDKATRKKNAEVEEIKQKLLIKEHELKEKLHRYEEMTKEVERLKSINDKEAKEIQLARRKSVQQMNATLHAHSEEIKKVQDAADEELRRKATIMKEEYEKEKAEVEKHRQEALKHLQAREKAVGLIEDEVENERRIQKARTNVKEMQNELKELAEEEERIQSFRNERKKEVQEKQREAEADIYRELKEIELFKKRKHNEAVKDKEEALKDIELLKDEKAELEEKKANLQQSVANTAKALQLERRKSQIIVSNKNKQMEEFKEKLKKEVEKEEVLLAEEVNGFNKEIETILNKASPILLSMGLTREDFAITNQESHSFDSIRDKFMSAKARKEKELQDLVEEMKVEYENLEKKFESLDVSVKKKSNEISSCGEEEHRLNLAIKTKKKEIDGLSAESIYLQEQVKKLEVSVEEKRAFLEQESSKTIAEITQLENNMVDLQQKRELKMEQLLREKEDCEKVIADREVKYALEVVERKNAVEAKFKEESVLIANCIQERDDQIEELNRRRNERQASFLKLKEEEESLEHTIKDKHEEIARKEKEMLLEVEEQKLQTEQHVFERKRSLQAEVDKEKQEAEREISKLRHEMDHSFRSAREEIESAKKEHEILLRELKKRKDEEIEMHKTEMDDIKKTHDELVRQMRERFETVKQDHVDEMSILEGEMENEKQYHRQRIMKLKAELENEISDHDHELEKSKAVHKAKMEKLQIELQKAEDEKYQLVRKAQEFLAVEKEKQNEEVKSVRKAHKLKIAQLEEEMVEIEKAHTLKINSEKDKMQNEINAHQEAIKNVEQEHEASICLLRQELGSIETEQKKKIESVRIEMQEEIQIVQKKRRDSVQEVQQYTEDERKQISVFKSEAMKLEEITEQMQEELLCKQRDLQKFSNMKQEEMKRLEDENTSLEKVISDLKLKHTALAIEKDETEMSCLEHDLCKERELNKQFKKLLESSNSEMLALENQLQSAYKAESDLKKELTAFRKEKEDLSKQNVSLEMEVKVKDEGIKILQMSIEELKSQVDVMKDLEINMKDEVKELEASMKDLERQLKETKASRNALQEKCVQFEVIDREVINLREKQQELEKDIAEKNDHIKCLQVQNGDKNGQILKTVDILRGKLKSNKKEMDALRVEHEREMSILVEEIKERQEDIKMKNNEIEDLRSEYEESLLATTKSDETMIAKLSEALSQAREDKKTLEKENEALVTKLNLQAEEFQATVKDMEISIEDQKNEIEILKDNRITSGSLALTSHALGKEGSVNRVSDSSGWGSLTSSRPSSNWGSTSTLAVRKPSDDELQTMELQRWLKNKAVIEEENFRVERELELQNLKLEEHNKEERVKNRERGMLILERSLSDASIGIFDKIQLKRGYTMVTFRVTCFLSPPKMLYVSGSSKYIGNWVPSEALRLQTNDEQWPLWTARTQVPFAKTLEYKYFSKDSVDSDKVDWEGQLGSRVIYGHSVGHEELKITEEYGVL